MIKGGNDILIIIIKMIRMRVKINRILQVGEKNNKKKKDQRKNREKRGNKKANTKEK